MRPRPGVRCRPRREREDPDALARTGHELRLPITIDVGKPERLVVLRRLPADRSISEDRRIDQHLGPLAARRVEAVDLDPAHTPDHQLVLAVAVEVAHEDVLVVGRLFSR